jgi:hypothetical protein
MPLAPGDSALYHLDATAPGLPPDGFLYTSDVTANAVDEAGADLTGVTEAAATDDTRVAAGAPLQLAFTGWETWLVAAAGLALSDHRSPDRRFLALVYLGRTPRRILSDPYPDLRLCRLHYFCRG